MCSSDLDDLTESISDSREQLKKWSQELERRVEERTSELKKVNMELLDTEFELMEREKLSSMGEISAKLAHEIKNPLQSLLGCLGLAQEAVKAGHAADKYFDVARDSVQRISGTVSQMRELYRPATVNKETVDINMLLDRLLTLIEKQCADSNVEIVWRPATESPPLMLVFDEIHQVFLNLALNALEAMPNGGELHVGSNFIEEPAGMQVFVADNGVGIAPDLLDHIFEPFYTMAARQL